MDDSEYTLQLNKLKRQVPTLEWKRNISDQSSYMDIEDCEAVEQLLLDLIESLIRIGVADLEANGFYIQTIKRPYRITEFPKVGFSNDEKEQMLGFLNQISAIIPPGALEHPDSRDHYSRIYRMGHKF